MCRGPITHDIAWDADRHIKMFLSYLHAFDQNKKTPLASPSTTTVNEMVDSIIWIIKFNFITILMIPRDMVRFGSLRLVWEGDGKAEGVLPDIKKVITSLAGDNWAFTAAEKFYKNRGLKRTGMALLNTMTNNGTEKNAAIQDLLDIGSALFGLAKDGTGENTWDQYKEVYTYPTYDNAATLFHNREDPICIVTFKPGFDLVTNHAIILKGYNAMIPVSLENIVAEQNGACYFQWNLGTEQIDVPFDCNVEGWRAKQNALLQVVDHYGLLLPGYFRQEQMEVGDIQFDFYYITSEWLEMLGNKEMGLPRVIGATY
jgi:hypothetical protein